MRSPGWRRTPGLIRLPCCVGWACAEATEADKQLEEEADIMKHVLQKAALKAVKELAQV